MYQVVCAALFLLVVVSYSVAFGRKVRRGSHVAQSSSDSVRSGFTTLRWQFLLAYLVASAADWIPGAYTYRLYEWHGLEPSGISALYISRFLSSVFLGTLVGPLSDVHGRRRGCTVYGVLYACSFLAKHSSWWSMLLVGSILDGICSSLLHSVFECWLISACHSLGCSDAQRGSIFSWMVSLNGLTAVLSALVAQTLVQMAGNEPTVAMEMAMVCALCSSVIVLMCFTENVGGKRVGVQPPTVAEQLSSAVQWLSSSRAGILVGCQQVCFESVMYIFIFLWTPTLAAANRYSGDGSVPHGTVFAAFMLATSVGGPLIRATPSDAKRVLPAVYMISAVALIPLCNHVRSSSTCLMCMVVLEGMIGVYLPYMYVLRSSVVPESHRATISNLYRLPVSLLACAIVFFAGQQKSESVETGFTACCVLLSLGALAGVGLCMKT